MIFDPVSIATAGYVGRSGLMRPLAIGSDGYIKFDADTRPGGGGAGHGAYIPLPGVDKLSISSDDDVDLGILAVVFIDQLDD